MKRQNLKEKKKRINQVYSNSETSRRASLARSIPIYSSSLSRTINNILLFLFILFLPTQLGKHFFFDFSYLSGVRVDYLAPTIYLTDIVALFLILLNLPSLIRFLRQKKILLLLAILFLNISLSRFPPLSMYRYIKILELLCIFLIFKKTKLSKAAILYGFLLGGIFELTLATAQFINKHSLQGLFYFFGERPLNLSLPGVAKASLNGVEILRPYGTFSHPNSLAGFYLLIYFFVLTRSRLISTDFNRFQPISTILLFVCSLLIFISFSKVAIITYILLNLIHLWRSTLKKDCRLCLISRTLILLIVPLLFLQVKADPLTLQKRLMLGQNALSVIAKYPLFGVGLDNYLPVVSQFTQRFPDSLNQPVHNIFLLFLSEVGILFSGVLLLLFLKEFKNAIKNAPYIFLAVLLTGLLDHYWLTLQQNFLLMGVVLGLL